MDYGFRFIEMQLSGYDRPYERHGNKYIVTAPGSCRMAKERFTWNPVNGSLSVEFLEENIARLFILTEN